MQEEAGKCEKNMALIIRHCCISLVSPFLTLGQGAEDLWFFVLPIYEELDYSKLKV